jgi:ABC-type phosphate transport system substrate-binding protein
MSCSEAGVQRIRIKLLCVLMCLGASAAHAQVVAVVSEKSTVTSLSRNQVVDIFLGKVARFPNGVQAVPIDQVEGAAARDEFYARFAGKSPAQVKAHWSKIIFTGRGQPPKAVKNSSETKKQLALNPNAIGYIELAAVDASVRVVGTPQRIQAQSN